MSLLRTVSGWCRQNPTDAAGAGAFLILLAGIGLLSVAWMLIVGGGVVFTALAASRVLGWDAPPPEKQRAAE